jgi:hypothetical protein
VDLPRVFEDDRFGVWNTHVFFPAIAEALHRLPLAVFFEHCAINTSLQLLQ